MLFWRWVSSFNLCPLFSYNHSSFHVTERREFFSFEHYIYPCSIKKLQAISLTSWQRTNSAHTNCALYSTQCVQSAVGVWWSAAGRGGGGGGEYGLRQVITCFTAQPNPHIWTAFNPPAFRSTLHTTFPFTSHFLNCHHLELVQMAKKWLWRTQGQFFYLQLKSFKASCLKLKHCQPLIMIDLQHDRFQMLGFSI